jgi:hypothetical protein
VALKEALVLLLRCFSTAASVGEEDGEGPIVYFWRSRSERAGVLALEYALHVRRLTDISTEATAHSLLASQSRKSIWACLEVSRLSHGYRGFIACSRQACKEWD